MKKVIVIVLLVLVLTSIAHADIYKIIKDFVIKDCNLESTRIETRYISLDLEEKEMVEINEYCAYLTNQSSKSPHYLAQFYISMEKESKKIMNISIMSETLALCILDKEELGTMGKFDQLGYKMTKNVQYNYSCGSKIEIIKGKKKNSELDPKNILKKAVMAIDELIVKNEKMVQIEVLPQKFLQVPHTYENAIKNLVKNGPIYCCPEEKNYKFEIEFETKEDFVIGILDLSFDKKQCTFSRIEIVKNYMTVLVDNDLDLFLGENDFLVSHSASERITDQYNSPDIRNLLSKSGF